MCLEFDIYLWNLEGKASEKENCLNPSFAALCDNATLSKYTFESFDERLWYQAAQGDVVVWYVIRFG